MKGALFSGTDSREKLLRDIKFSLLSLLFSILNNDGNAEHLVGNIDGKMLRLDSTECTNEE